MDDMADWTPMNEDEFSLILQQEIEETSPELCAELAKIRVPIYKLTAYLDKNRDEHQAEFFIFAKLDNIVLHYDTIEEEFGSAYLSPSGKLYEASNFGELKFLLTHLFSSRV